MNKRLRIIVAVVVLLLAVALVVYLTRWRTPQAAGGPGGRGAAGQAVSVRAVAARSGSIDVAVDALGTALARNTVIVRARVDGQLIRVGFEEGREVRAGAVLAEIDPRPFDAALQQTQGQLARDEALLAIARSDLDRYRKLLEQDSIAAQQVDDQAALVRQDEGIVQADRGTVANARLQRDFTRITAPIGGRVGLRQVDVGNMVHATDANGVVVLTETKPINVVFAVPADRAPEIDRRWRSGTPLRVDAYDRDGKTLLSTGRLDSADNVVDPATSTVKMKALFANADGALFPNQFVNARLTITTLDEQVLVPAAAVQRGTPGTFVYVVGSDATVALRPIDVGVTNGDTVSVRRGVKVGEQLVVDGTDKLRDGSKVEAAVDAPTPAPQRSKGPRTGAKPGPGTAAPPGADTKGPRQPRGQAGATQ